jgi:hypothetical protein
VDVPALLASPSHLGNGSFQGDVGGIWHAASVSELDQLRDQLISTRRRLDDAEREFKDARFRERKLRRAWASSWSVHSIGVGVSSGSPWVP